MPKRRTRRRPFIGPCNDLMELWFLEFEQDGQVFRRYFGYRPEAKAALDLLRAQPTPAQQRMLDVIRRKAGADGWADWDHVYPAWEPTNVPVQFGGRAGQLVWKALLKRGLVEDGPGGKVRVK